MSRMTSRQKQGTIWFSFLMKIYIHVHGKNANPHHHKQHDTMGTEKEPPTLSNSEKPSNKDHHKHGKIQSLINISNITHQAWKWTHDTVKKGKIIKPTIETLVKIWTIPATTTNHSTHLLQTKNKNSKQYHDTSGMKMNPRCCKNRQNHQTNYWNTLENMNAPNNSNNQSFHASTTNNNKTSKQSHNQNPKLTIILKTFKIKLRYLKSKNLKLKQGLDIMVAN